MKIGIDARFFGPGSKGLGRYTQKLVTHLEDIDHTNQYVIFLRKDNFEAYKPKNKNFKKVLADYRWYTLVEQVFFPITLYKERCDTVHFPHFNVPILYFGKILVTIHDLILLRYPTHKASTHSKIFYKFKFLMYRLVIFNALSRAKKIIAVSKFTKDDICKLYKKVCNKIDVIYEAAEIKLSEKTDKEIDLKKYGIMNEYILYVGNAYPHKNLYTLVDAFALYLKRGGKAQNLVLVGRNDYFYDNLRVHIKQKQIAGIIILDTVTDEVLYKLYKGALFFVFPSLYEGFGLPPLEAQLLGVSVLSSEHKCMKEILSEEGALYCDASSKKELADSMQLLSTDFELRANLVKIGLLNAKKYSWQRMAKETHKKYMEL